MQQDVHLHGTLDRADIDLSGPAVLIQSTDLLAIDRRRENRGDNFELLDAIVLVASIHRYLTHQELLGVASVLFSRHSERLLGALPNDDIAIRSAFRYSSSLPLKLSVNDQVDTAIVQIAGDEVIVEEGVGKHYITGLERVIHASEKALFASALAGVRRDGQIVASAGRQGEQHRDPCQRKSSNLPSF